MSSETSDTVRVSDNPEEHRFEITLDGELAGFAVYRRRPGVIAFIHTEVDERFAHHGLASTLIKTALDTARADHLEVLPFCPFVASYIQNHREYADLVPARHREGFGL